MKRMLISLALAACGTSTPQTPADSDPFGDEGTPSASAAELLDKHDSTPNDKLAGVYERTGSGSGIYETDSFFTVTNNFTLRTELRAEQVTTVLQCKLTYNEPGRAAKTLTPFVTQAAIADDTSLEITEAGKRTETDAVSMTDCAIDQKAETWAFCDVSSGIAQMPAGASLCIAIDDGELFRFEKVSADVINGDSLGVKVAN